MADHQVFICHSSLNAATAREVVDYLEARGVRCWISSRDVAPGQNFQEAIVRGLRAARILLLLFTEAANRSTEIQKELALAGMFNLAVLPLRMSAIAPSEALLYELSTRQWIDGWPDAEIAYGRLMVAIGDILSRTETGVPGTDQSTRIVARAPSPASPAPVSPALPVPASRRRTRAPIGADLDAVQVQQLRALLAQHVGPIARLLVDRAVADSRRPDTLCDRLAAHLPATADRAAFLHAARLVLAREA